MFNVNSILMVLPFVVSNFLFSNYMFKKFGMRVTVGIGLLLVSLCCWCRTLINLYFPAAMFGALFLGLAQPFIINADTEIASNWFDHTEVRPSFTL